MKIVGELAGKLAGLGWLVELSVSVALQKACESFQEAAREGL
jgi:hypothetical protein